MSIKSAQRAKLGYLVQEYMRSSTIIIVTHIMAKQSIPTINATQLHSFAIFIQQLDLFMFTLAFFIDHLLSLFSLQINWASP